MSASETLTSLSTLFTEILGDVSYICFLYCSFSMLWMPFFGFYSVFLKVVAYEYRLSGLRSVC